MAFITRLAASRFASLTSKRPNLGNDIDNLILIMRGRTAFINPILLEKIQKHIDLNSYIIETNFYYPQDYPKEKLGENIALKWVGNTGFGNISVVTPDEFKDFLFLLEEENPELLIEFIDEMTFVSFYGFRKTKSY